MVGVAGPVIPSCAVIASIALRNRNVTRNEAIQATTGKTQIPPSDDQRRRLASKGKALTLAEREECPRSWPGSGSSSPESVTTPRSEDLGGRGWRTRSESCFAASPLRTLSGDTPKSTTLEAVPLEPLGDALHLRHRSRVAHAAELFRWGVRWLVSAI